MQNRLKWMGVLVAIFSLLVSPAGGTELAVHGFLQGNYAVNTASTNPDGGDYKLAEERAQLKFEADQNPLRLFVKTDVAWDHLDDEAKLALREGFLDFTASAWDLRVGRQIITWGVGDLLFINDVFPKDYEAFFSGRPLEYLKKGVDGAKFGLYPGFVSFELVAVPFFEPNHFPDAERFWMFDPMPSVTNRSTQEPATSVDNTEIAVRAYRDIAGFDASLYCYRGFFRQPAMQPDNPALPTEVTNYYPELAVYGASLQGSALAGVISLEAGYYDSRQDRAGTDPTLPNSQIRFLVGYQRQLWEDFTVGVQYYGEIMAAYEEYTAALPPGFPKENQLHQLAGIRLTQLLVHQTVRLSLFSFWSPSDGDYLVNPEIKHNFTDHVWAALGANIFGGGERWSQFGQFNKDDNIYLQARYEF